MTYENLTDEEIVSLIKSGDKSAVDFLLDKHKKLVRLKARAYFIMGADADDLMQEGMIGLYKAIRDYDDEKNVPFAAFAILCVERQILSAIKNASRHKHSPLNSYVSLSTGNLEQATEIFSKTPPINPVHSSPEEMLISQERKSIIETSIKKTLSKMERMVLSLYLNGASYLEIAEHLNKDEKSVDNAIQRVRKKMRRFNFHLNEY